MRQKFLTALGPHGLHRLSYWEWGQPRQPLLLCVHGLSRNGRDFQPLAERLSRRWRVVAPDMPGRGDSAWLPQAADYALPTYLAACVTLIARLEVERLVWLGTSLGGIIGMNLAALPGSPIERLILNDIGPEIPAEALRQIGSRLGSSPRRFADLDAAEQWCRQQMGGFGIRAPENWRLTADISTRPAADGGLRPHYDPAILSALTDQPETLKDILFWPVWEAIACPTLLLRGEQSDLLTAATARRMTASGPRATLVEIPGCGHAPGLMEEDQMAVIDQWLE